MHIGTLIMIVACAPVLLIVCAMFANETKPKKNIVLGVTLPWLSRDDERVRAVCRRFKKRLWWTGGIMTALFLPTGFIPYFSVQLTVLMVWILLAVLAPGALYVRANRQLKALKREQAWKTPHSGGTVLDLNTVELPSKPLSKWWFIPALILSLVPFALSLTLGDAAERLAFALISGIMALCVAVSWMVYPLIFRRRGDVAGEDSRINAALTQVRRYNWGKAWIALAWASALLSLVLWFTRNSATVVFLTACGYSLGVSFVCIRTEFVTRAVQERLTAAGGGDYVDEDDFWPMGLFYYNPNDSHVTVNDRVGMSMSFNLAKPAGKAIMGVSALLLLALPFVGVWLMAVEFSPRTAYVEDGACVVEHVTERFRVDLAELVSVERIDELPPAKRVAGTGLSTLLEGRFRAEGYGPAELSLDPRAGPYVVLRTEELTYIFSLMSPEETEAIYFEIRSMTHA